MSSSVISVFSSKGLTTLFSTLVAPLLQNEFDGLPIPNVTWKGKTFSETPKTENDPHKTVKIDLSLTGGKVDIVTLSTQKVESKGKNIYVEFTGNTRLEYALWKEDSTPTITHKSFSFAPKSDFSVKNFHFQITPLTISGGIKISLSKGTFSTNVNLAAPFASVDLTPPARSALVNFPDAEAALLKTLRTNLSDAFASALSTRIQSSISSAVTNQLNKFIQTVSLYQNDDIKYQYDDEHLSENLQICSEGNVFFKGKQYPGKVDPVKVPVPQHDQAIAISHSVFEAVLWAGASEGLGNATITGDQLPVPDFLTVDYYASMPDLKPFVDQYKGKDMVVNVTLPTLTAGVDKSINSLKYTAGINLQITIDNAQVFSAVVNQQGTVVVSPKQHTQGTFLDLSFKQGKTAVDKTTTTVKDLSVAVATQFITTLWSFGLLPTYLIKLGAIGSLGVPLPVTPISQVTGQTWTETGVVIDVAVATSDAILHLF